MDSYTTTFGLLLSIIPAVIVIILLIVVFWMSYRTLLCLYGYQDMGNGRVTNNLETAAVQPKPSSMAVVRVADTVGLTLSRTTTV